MDKAALQARVLAKLGKEVPPSRAPKAKAPARAPQPLPDSGSDDGSASSSSSEDWRIEVAPVARARKGYADDAISDGSADSAESESKERHPPLIARGLCSRRQLGRCIRQRRRSLQIALAAIVVTVLGFVVTTLLYLKVAEQPPPPPGPRYRTGDLPQEAWLAAGWGLPPVLRQGPRPAAPAGPAGPAAPAEAAMPTPPGM
ncbi:unnamed protein product [Effrenium voratum]|nr:unnamed protein product [Effrenium voratum]